MPGPTTAEWVLSGSVLAAVGGTALHAALGAERRAQLRALTRLRARRAERTAFEASLDDPVFAPEAIRAAVEEVLDLAQKVWAGQPIRWARHHNANLIRGWAWAHERKIGVGLRIKRRPRIYVLREVNRGGEDRAIVRVRLRIHRDHNASELSR